MITVYAEMLSQVLADYPGLGGDWRDLEADEIEWLYDGLRSSLRKATKPSK